MSVEIFKKCVHTSHQRLLGSINSNSKLSIWIIPFIYALSLCFLIPNDAKLIIDRENYWNYINNSKDLIVFYWNISPLVLVANEPLWLLINFLLSSLFTQANAVYLIIFFSSYLFARVVLKQNKGMFWFVILCLLSPQLIKNYIIHLRQGLAVTVFIMAHFQNGKFKKQFQLLLTPFIHASFFLLIPLYYLSYFIANHKIFRHFTLAIFVTIGFLIAFLTGIVATFMGSRQADEYLFNGSLQSGFGFVFWSLILLLISFQGKKFIYRNPFVLILLITYLTTYFNLEVTARIFESGLILVLLSYKELTNWRKQCFLIAILFYFIFGYFQKLGLPYLGWGVN